MLTFDIEANGLLDTVTNIHCIVIHDTSDDVYYSYTPNIIADGVAKLQEAIDNDVPICGHNIIDYDIPTIQKLYNLDIPREKRHLVIDTLVLSRLIAGNIKETDISRMRKGQLPGQLLGSHSLKAWGYRLGELKGNYAQEHEDAWATFNNEMLDYCKQDVNVTHQLYVYLTRYPYPSKAIELEHQAAWLMTKQKRNGFSFDIDKALKLLHTLTAHLATLSAKLCKAVPRVPDKIFIPKRDNKTKGYIKGVPIQRYKDFNPNSRQQIEWLITKHYSYTPDNEELFEGEENPRLKIDDDTFNFIKQDNAAPAELRELAHVFEEYLMVNKRVGQLATGTQAWLSHIGKDGRIHGSVNPCGAVTGRATHANPNLAQVPAVNSPYGHECRELFTVPEGWYQAGIDASGLELRCLAHFTYPYDEGAYADTILNGDIHTANQLAAGLPTRNDAKTFIYAFLYGAGDAKIGRIVGGDVKDGRRLKKKFLAQTPAISSLRQAVQDVLVDSYHGQTLNWKRKYLKGLDGRPLHVRSLHSALNLLLQSAGALICKKWICLLEENLINKGLDHGRDFQYMAWVHDEVQVACRTKEIAEIVVATAQESMREAQAYYGFRVQLDTEGKIGKNWSDCH